MPIKLKFTSEGGEGIPDPKIVSCAFTNFKVTALSEYLAVLKLAVAKRSYINFVSTSVTTVMRKSFTTKKHFLITLNSKSTNFIQ